VEAFHATLEEVVEADLLVVRFFNFFQFLRNRSGILASFASRLILFLIPVSKFHKSLFLSL